MPGVVPIAPASWVAVCVVLFRRLPARDAALVGLIAGWALLPTGRYPASGFGSPKGYAGSVHAVAIPADLLVNKATAVALGCLAGAMVFRWSGLRRVRPNRLDLPMAVWCLVPVASTLANGRPLAEGLAQARYLALAWGVPYLMGRAYLTDSEGLRRLGLGFVLAGLAYVPLCLLEFVARPFLYVLVYGPHPYQFEGSERFLGYRPLVFLEHGNQLGIWMATASVAAVWLWKAGRLPAIAGLSAGHVAAGLVAVSLLCQSHAALVLTALAVVSLSLTGRRPTPVAIPGAFRAACVVLICLALAASAAVVARKAGDRAARDAVRSAFVSVGKTSFTWRLIRSEELLEVVTQRPALGWGRADWSSRGDGTFLNPVNLGLWLLAFGMYGAVGLVSLTAVLVVPVVAALRRLPRGAWLSPSGSAVTLTSVLLLINLGDSLLNSEWIVPLLAGAGGLNGWSSRRTRPGGGRVG